MVVFTCKNWSVTEYGTMIYKMGTTEETRYEPSQIDDPDFVRNTLAEGWMQPEVFMDAYLCSCRFRGIQYPKIRTFI
jgi:hypothetical protein